MNCIANKIYVWYFLWKYFTQLKQDTFIYSKHTDMKKTIELLLSCLHFNPNYILELPTADLPNGLVVLWPQKQL